MKTGEGREGCWRHEWPVWSSSSSVSVLSLSICFTSSSDPISPLIRPYYISRNINKSVSLVNISNQTLQRHSSSDNPQASLPIFPHPLLSCPCWPRIYMTYIPLMDRGIAPTSSVGTCTELLSFGPQLYHTRASRSSMSF
jgi:hypothetical protein